MTSVSMVAIHTICSLSSYVAFLIAFLAGLLFLIQERQLKRKHMGWLFYRLPALETLDRINLLAIGSGFVLLSLGLVCGLYGAWMWLKSPWSFDPKVWLTILLWALYLALWSIRLRAILRGRRVAWLSMLGFSVVVFTFVGVRGWLPTWHAFL